MTDMTPLNTITQTNLLRHSSWLVTPYHRPEAQVRLFCIPFAGGSASFFHHWSELVPKSIEICAVELPGRGLRFGEPLCHHIDFVIDHLVSDIKLLCDKDFVIFGHSLGALIGFETVRRLDALGIKASAFIASGRRSPSSRCDGPPLYELDDKNLIEQLRRYNGTPEEILGDSDMLSIFLPIIRADLQINETYVYVPEPKLTCQIHAFAGTLDCESPPSLVEFWGRETKGIFSLELIPGGHFFLKECEPLFMEALVRKIKHIGTE